MSLLNLYKWSSSFGIILMFLICILLTTMTIYGWTNQDLFWSDQRTKELILGLMATVSFLLLMVSIIAVAGILRKVFCLIFVYQIFVILFVCAFLSLGIGAIVLPGQIFNGPCNNSTYDQVKQAHQIYEQSSLNFCKIGCPCFLSPASLAKYSIIDQQILRINYRISGFGVNSTQMCQSSSNWTHEQLNIASALSQVQQILECSSWCPSTVSNLFYRFTNVNNGKPTSFCYTALSDVFRKYSGIVQIVSFVVAAIFFLILICNLLICCHKTNRNKKLNQRFQFLNDQDQHKVYYRTQ